MPSYHALLLNNYSGQLDSSDENDCKEDGGGSGGGSGGRGGGGGGENIHVVFIWFCLS